MNTFQNYFDNIEQLLDIKDFNQLTKRLIDLTLDTKDVLQYQKMLTTLDWLDTSPLLVDVEKKFTESFSALKEILINRPIANSDRNTRLVSIQNLEKTYSNSAFKLGPVNLELKSSQMIGLVGENGNGKTTLLRLLSGELEPSFGKIEYHFDYTDDYDLRSQLIYIPQRTATWQGSLLDNLQFTAAMYGVKGVENEMLVQLVIARMGIRTFRNYAWASLSSGYKMRFELARALLRNPKLLLIDEPLANLDILAQKNVLDDLKGIAQSPFRPMGLLLSSQQLYDVEKNSDDVLFLKKGEQKNLLTANEANATESIETTEKEAYIVEFETSWTISEVKTNLSGLNCIDIQINGGTYIMRMPHNTTQADFLKHVLQTKMPMNYFRDISKSTRRFFL